MSFSLTTSESTTFTITHAKHLASKIATDLKRMQRFYGSPSDTKINDLEYEAICLLKNGYLKKVTYGYKKDGDWIEPSLVYTVEHLNSDINDDPGKIRPGKDTSNARFSSFLEYTSEWHAMSEREREDFESGLPFQRTFADTPGISGYLENDKNYSSGGQSLSRSSVRSY